MDTQKACSSCGEPIIWLKTLSGKWMPVDVTDEAEHRLEAGQPFEAGRGDLISHFATCPNARAHRKS